MKAKEAPEKLYIIYKGYGVFDEDSTIERTKDSQTEYTRTDAFIEKACEWLKEIFFEYENLTDYNPMDDFKNHMKGE